jgi:hypothetical protein
MPYFRKIFNGDPGAVREQTGATFSSLATPTKDPRGARGSGQYRLPYFSSKNRARISVEPVFSVECSSGSRHITFPARTPTSALSPIGDDSLTWPVLRP